MTRKKVGLALSSGAAWGLAHIGVLAELAKGGVPVDMITGTSMGAIVGSFYATGKNPDEIAEAARAFSRRRILSLADFDLPTRGLIKGGKLRNWLKSVIGDRHFDELNLPFACLSTDINTGEAVVLREGLVAPAVAASASIPGLFTPVRRDGRYLVDGWLVEPLPVALLREMGADFIIAVSVMPYLGGRGDGEAAVDKSRPPTLIGSLIRMMYIMGCQAAWAAVAQADVMITPSLTGIRPDSFDRLPDCIRSGMRAAREAVPEIKARLGA